MGECLSPPSSIPASGAVASAWPICTVAPQDAQQESWTTVIVGDSKWMQRKHAPGRVHVAITDPIEKANRILEKIDERWPAETVSEPCR